MKVQGRRLSLVVQKGLVQCRDAVQPWVVKWRRLLRRRLSQQQLQPKMNTQSLQWKESDASLHFGEAWNQI